MKNVFEKIVERLLKLKTLEAEQEEYVDENGMWNDCEEAFYDGESNGRYQAYAKTIEIVKQVADEYGKDTNVPSNDGWIPCSEKMPPLYKPILLTVDVNGEMEIEIAEWLGDFEWMFDDEFYTFTEANWKVIAWRELPAPYQPKGEQI